MKKILSAIFLSILLLSIVSCKKNNPTATSYAHFKINTITLTSFPAKDGTGSDWDFGLGSLYLYPDLYTTIDSVSTNIYNGSVYNISEVNPTNGLPVSWNSTVDINSLSASYYINLYDSDIDSPDLIGQIPFVLYDHKNGYPTAFSITNGTTSITLSGTWY